MHKIQITLVLLLVFSNFIFAKTKINRKISSIPSYIKCGDVALTGKVIVDEGIYYIVVFENSMNQFFVRPTNEYLSLLKFKVNQSIKIRGYLKIQESQFLLSFAWYNKPIKDMIYFISKPELAETLQDPNKAIAVINPELCN